MHVKINMTKIISVSVLMLCCIFIFSSIANAAIYYVDATSGNDSNAGLSPSSPWKTIGKVNGFSFSAGDTVKFQRGETFNDATLRSPGVNNFTFEDYGTGAKPLFDGDVIRPIYISDATISNLTIRNIDISGQDWQLGKQYNLSIEYVDGVTIDGVIGDGHAGGNDVGQIGKSVMLLFQTIGTSTVTNCTLYNWGPADLLSGTKDLMGIVIFEVTAGTVSIHDNTIHDITADGFHLYLSTVNQYVYDNVLYNFGEQAIDVKATSNVEIYDNEFYTEPGFLSGSGGTGGRNTFIATGSAGISNDNIIRDNYFHDSPRVAIWFANGSRCKAYRNQIKDTAGGIIVTNPSHDTEIYNNIIINTDSFITDSVDAGSILLWNGTGSGSKIYNNTIYNKSATPSIYGINAHATGSGADIKNNIVYLDNNDVNAYAFHYKGYGTGPTVDHNIGYNPSNTNRTKWVSTTYSDSQLSNWTSAGHTGAIFSDPLFVNAASDDFHLQSSSPAIDAGVDVGLTQDNDGVTVPQGSIADMGAFEYVSGNVSAPPPPSPFSQYYETESMDLVSPMTLGNDTNASQGQYISPTSGTNSTSPIPEATFNFTVPETDTYYLWMRLMGPDAHNDALYVGIDNTWDRVYSSTTNIYEWLKVETSHGSSNYQFNLNQGNHTFQIGHGEINARVDVLFLTNDPNGIPSFSTSDTTPPSPPPDFGIP